MQILFQTMIAIFAMITTGYILQKKDLADERFSQKLSALVVNVTNPCLMIYSVLSFDRKNSDSNVWLVLLLGFVMYFFLVIIAKLLSHGIPKISEDDRIIYELSLAFGNVGFIGIPIYHALYGNEGVFLSVILNLPFNLVMFTYGIRQIAKTSRKKVDFSISKIFSPGFLGALGAFLVYVFDLRFPPVVQQYLKYMSAITVPASMLIIGSSLGRMSFFEIVQNKNHLLISFGKLILMPLIVFFAFRLFMTDPKVLSIAVLSVAMPCGSVMAMLAEDLEGNIETATAMIFLTTLISMGTIPLIQWLQTLWL